LIRILTPQRIESEIVTFGNIHRLISRVPVIPIFLISVLIAGSMILPLANAQQISSINASTYPIKHIVIIMQENRSFDNYFGTYPAANGISKNACMPLSPDHPDLGCVKPFLSTSPVSEDIPHTSHPSLISYDNGKMDGFMLAVKAKTMSYYDIKTIPYYWGLAKQYVLADNFYSSVLSYSLPNHWYSVAGQVSRLLQLTLINEAKPRGYI
jgi:phospholipase C